MFCNVVGHSGIKIPIAFKNDSLLVSGFVRVVSHSLVEELTYLNVKNLFLWRMLWR